MVLVEDNILFFNNSKQIKVIKVGIDEVVFKNTIDNTEHILYPSLDEEVLNEMNYNENDFDCNFVLINYEVISLSELSLKLNKTY